MNGAIRSRWGAAFRGLVLLCAVLALWPLALRAEPPVLYGYQSYINRWTIAAVPARSKYEVCEIWSEMWSKVFAPTTFSDPWFYRYQTATEANPLAWNGDIIRCANGPSNEAWSIGGAACGTSISGDEMAWWWLDTSRDRCVMPGRTACKKGEILINGVCHCGENCGCCKDAVGNPAVGNPVNPATGNKYWRESLYRGSSGFRMDLVYNSQDDEGLRFGRRWRDSFDRRVQGSGTGAAIVFRPDGKAIRYTLGAAGWTSNPGVSDVLTGGTVGWQLSTANGDEVETYDVVGLLRTIRTRSGLVQTFEYSDGSGTAPNGAYFLRDARSTSPFLMRLPAGWLIRVYDNFGRRLSFDYGFHGRVARVIDSSGVEYRFAYDEYRNLISVTFPDGAIRSFLYNEPSYTSGAFLMNALTGITDENGSRTAFYRYDSQGRAIATEHAGGVERHTLAFNSDGSTTVTDPLGIGRTYRFQDVNGVLKIASITGPACAGCGPPAQTYDPNGNLSSSVDWNGNRTNYSYDLARNLETSRTEGLTAAGTPTASTRTISTEWHSSFRLPVRVAEPLKITSYVYNGDGGMVCGTKADGVTPVPAVLCAKTIQATSDADGSQAFAAMSAGTPRTWRYTYNANGLVLAADGPRTDVADITTTAYYAESDPDLGKRGNVATITNALGHVTSFTAYNAFGQPTTIVDPNGLTTTLAYDARQRLVSRSVGAETTSYEYDGVGQLTKVTLPDGSFLTYAYDAAHRLIDMADSLGNSIAYTLDAMGNRTKEEVLDPAGALAQTRSRVFNNLNRLFQEIGASGQTTEYSYDNQGNVISVKDPLNRVTSNQYDALNRLAQVTDPNLGQTRYGYNGLDALTSVTDPRGLVTGYAVDGLGNLTQQVSPDTGTTANTYDPAGNVLTQTDAKGQAAAYVYDALNRVTSITFADGSKQTYAYDQGPNGLGRLGSITESDSSNQVAGQIAYAYDAQGRVTSETRTLAGVSYVTAYGYDGSGRLSSITYPSGRSVVHGFDTQGRVNRITTAFEGKEQVVAQTVQYHPFGGVKSYTLGNGQIVARAIDLDGRIAGYTLGADSYSLSFDAASRITGISQTGNPANAGSYGYDALDRLTSAVLPNAAYGYGYDAVGNRTSKTTGAASDLYRYEATSNRLASVTPASGPVRSHVFDANGSTTNDGLNQYAYDARGRMVSATSSAGTTAYQVNALGQRVAKRGPQGATLYHYDTRGRLIAETDAEGNLKRELLYLGDLPVAVFQ